jgi:hypothetical protein
MGPVVDLAVDDPSKGPSSTSITRGPKAPVQESLVVHRPPHLGQVLPYPVEECATVALPRPKQLVS